MEILSAAPARRIRTGSWIRKPLAWTVLPCLAAGLMLGCHGHEGMPPIVVDAFTPTQGAAGTQGTITGSGLSNVTWLSVGEGGVMSWNIVSDSQINFTLPASATTGVLTLNDPEYNYSTTSDFTVLPIIAGVVPDSGPAGTEVKVTGSGFVGATLVTFGSEPSPGSSFTVQGPNQINAYIGNDATTGPVQVTVGGTTVAGPVFTVTNP